MNFAPHPYQAYCIGQIIEKPALALWLDMGLGKSVITLSAIARLRYDLLQVGKVLIVAPKKVAEATWQQEACKWSHLEMLRVSTVLGSTQKRIRALAEPADIYIINRDNVAWLVDYYQHAWPFDMVVLDESSSFKNQQSKRWKKLKAVRPHIRRIVELTGTPAPQALLDLVAADLPAGWRAAAGAHGRQLPGAVFFARQAQRHDGVYLQAPGGHGAGRACAAFGYLHQHAGPRTI